MHSGTAMRLLLASRTASIASIQHPEMLHFGDRNETVNRKGAQGPPNMKPGAALRGAPCSPHGKNNSA